MLSSIVLTHRQTYDESEDNACGDDDDAYGQLGQSVTGRAILPETPLLYLYMTCMVSFRPTLFCGCQLSRRGSGSGHRAHGRLRRIGARCRTEARVDRLPLGHVHHPAW